MDPGLFRRAAALVLKATRVHVVAQRRAFPVAAYLAYGLSQLEVPAFLLDSVAGMRLTTESTGFGVCVRASVMRSA